MTLTDERLRELMLAPESERLEHKASADDERQLVERRRAGDLPFELRPVAEASLDDLDLDLFAREVLPASVAAEVLEANRRTREEQLASLRMVTAAGRPTVLGLLAIGRDPRVFVPGAWLQFLRIEGQNLGEAIQDAKELDYPVGDLLRRIDEVLEAHVKVAVDLSGTKEARHPDYPIRALQELVRNAVLHRNYEGTAAPVRITWFEDRIEILSPGGPYGQVRRENFGQPGVTDYRNPALGAVLKDLGYVQRFGVGIELARRALADNGNPPPEFEVHPENVLVVVRRSA